MKSIPNGSYVYRFWHNINGHWCHAWDMEESGFRMFRDKTIPMKASLSILPSGDRPSPGARIQCGTCSATAFTLRSMKIERVSYTSQQVRAS